jgi:hypothetical protein
MRVTSERPILWIAMGWAVVAAGLAGCGTKSAPMAAPGSPAPSAPGKGNPGDAVPPEEPVDPVPFEGSSTADPPRASTAPAAQQSPAEKPLLAADVPANVPDSLREHVAALQALGATIDYGIGDRIVEVDLDGKPVTDADLVHVKPLADLRILNLSGTAVTDAGLKELTSLSRLKFVYLFNTNITDAGMEALQALPRLEVLCLDQTQITDVGLKALEELPRLEKLHVHSKAPITDAGLESLKKHIRLFELRVGGPHITEEALERLKAALPNCNVIYDPAVEVPEG